MVKDRFLVLTIGELLDDLYGYFLTKPLQSGYHQICMNEIDIHKAAFYTRVSLLWQLGFPALQLPSSHKESNF